mgnify:CR=1 FL=1
MKKYKLAVIAPDGEYKTEGEFSTIEEAWDRNNDMGSRWFFYPFRVVVAGSVVRSTPEHSEEYVGRKLSTFCKAVAFSCDTDDAMRFALETGMLRAI